MFETNLRGTARKGFFEALLASMQYEADRKRCPEPRPNLGLARALSSFQGLRLFGAVQAARAIGISADFRHVKAAQKAGLWVGIHNESRTTYVSDETFQPELAV